MRVRLDFPSLHVTRKIKPDPISSRDQATLDQAASARYRLTPGQACPPEPKKAALPEPLFVKGKSSLIPFFPSDRRMSTKPRAIHCEPRQESVAGNTDEKPVSVANRIHAGSATSAGGPTRSSGLSDRAAHTHPVSPLRPRPLDEWRRGPPEPASGSPSCPCTLASLH